MPVFLIWVVELPLCRIILIACNNFFKEVIMRGLYYLTGAIAIAVFVLGIDLIYAANQADTVTVEEDVVSVPATSAPATSVTLEGQTPNSAPVVATPINDAKNLSESSAGDDGVVIVEEGEMIAE